MKGDFVMLKARSTFLLVGLASLALGLLPMLAGAGACNSKGARFYVPAPDKGAVQQIHSLIKQHQFQSAALIDKMTDKSHAVWLSGGTPADVQKQVRKTMHLARWQHAVPVLVAYDLPFRDCGQYSAGGALNTADYLAWIDGLAKGIGDGKAVVLLEPDGLGIIPDNTTIYGQAEWCKPDLTGTGLTEEQANQARYDQLNGAVDRLEQQPNVNVYLDGTHAAWLGVGEAAYRLFHAGVERAQGFFLNVSNYQTTENSVTFGTWVSDCIAFATNPAEGGWRLNNFSWCASQYNPALNYAVDYSPAYAQSVTDQLTGLMGSATAATHFVIDTSRNGQGPWTGGASYTDRQDWCNPPGRGVGITSTTETGNALVDAYLWVKVPGESDGSCNRGVSGSTTDPEWGGIVDPAAGEWFPQQALQLAQLASPTLK
jgi:endoglucanase